MQHDLLLPHFSGNHNGFTDNSNNNISTSESKQTINYSFSEEELFKWNALCESMEKCHISFKESAKPMEPRMFWNALVSKDWKQQKVIHLKQQILEQFGREMIHVPHSLFYCSESLWRLFQLYDMHYFNGLLDYLLSSQHVCLLFEISQEQKNDLCREPHNSLCQPQSTFKSTTNILFRDTFFVNYSVFMQRLSISRKQTLPPNTLPPIDYILSIKREAITNVQEFIRQFEHEFLHFIENFCLKQCNFSDLHSSDYQNLWSKLFNHSNPFSNKIPVSTDSTQKYQVGQYITFWYPLSDDNKTSSANDDANKISHIVSTGIIKSLYEHTLKVIVLPEKTLWWKGSYSRIISTLSPLTNSSPSSSFSSHQTEHLIGSVSTLHRTQKEEPLEKSHKTKETLKVRSNEDSKPSQKQTSGTKKKTKMVPVFKEKYLKSKK
jgi:hypothetical protein